MTYVEELFLYGGLYMRDVLFNLRDSVSNVARVLYLVSRSRYLVCKPINISLGVFRGRFHFLCGGIEFSLKEPDLVSCMIPVFLGLEGELVELASEVVEPSVDNVRDELRILKRYP